MQGTEEVGQIKQVRNKDSPVVPSCQAAELPGLHCELKLNSGFTATHMWLAGVQNQEKLELWDVEADRSPQLCSFKAHIRPVT